MNVTLASTLMLTLLLAVGLFFFIRASAKDRTEQMTLSQQEAASLLEQLEQYFNQRAYQVKALDSAHNQVTYEGFVKPSIFLAVFLSVLAAIGILCLALVWSLLFPNLDRFFLGLVFLSPIAGIFYWKKAARREQVLLKFPPTEELQSKITVVAHRDELIELQKALKLKPSE